jgi:hypothetical protein
VFGNFKEIIAENAAESIAENLTKTQDNYKLMTPDEGALINYGEISPTFIGLAKLLPQAAINALFRPFLWEAKKLTSLMAAIEGAFFFGLTIFVFFRRGPLTPFKMMAKDSTILFSFLFSIVFATAIGMNCFNLGTLVRYKIPCLPFYIISLMLIYKKQNTDKELTTIS